jgi:GGDEF domain-containing protein
MSHPPPSEPPAPAVLARADDICRRIGGESQQGVDELLRALRGEGAPEAAIEGDAFRSRWTEGEEALVDGATGTASRILFRDRLRHSLARYFRCGTRFAVVYVGHRGVDSAAAARSIAAGLRSTDTVAAAGEDELAVLLDTLAAAADAEAVAARMRMELIVRHPGIGVYIGVAHLAPHGTDAETVLWSAYTAMCRARRFGSGRIEVASVGA